MCAQSAGAAVRMVIGRLFAELEASVRESPEAGRPRVFSG
jgi:hypothetical protein